MDIEQFKRYALDYWAWWEKQSATRKVGMVFICSVLFGFAAIIWWSGQPEYRLLYSNVSGEEMSPILEKLKSKGIAHRTDSSGSALYVRSDQAAVAHIEISSQNLLGNAKIGKGLERFDGELGLGATPFSQGINLLHAQQSDLARAIMQVDPITYARVFIARPQTTMFMRDRKPTTASVMLKVRPGGVLDRRALHALSTFIAGSIDGLSPDDVKIMDGTKKILYQSQDSELGFGGSGTEMKRELEAYLGERAEKMLVALLGPGRVVVTVNTEISNKLQKEKLISPMAEGKVVTKENLTEGKLTGGGSAGKGGIPGTTAAFGGATGSGGGGDGSKSITSKSDVEFDYPRKWVEWQQRYGDVERMSIAAAVDLSGGKNGESPISVEQIQELLKNAVGFKVGRDQIQVQEFKMPSVNTDSLDEEWASHQRLQTILTIVRNGSIAAVTLCLGGLGFVYLRKRLALAAAAPAPALAAATTSPSDQLQRLSEEFNRNPDALAQVLSRWIEQSEAADRVAA